MGWLLAVCCVAQFMVILDLSIVNVALPHDPAEPRFLQPGAAVGRGRVRDHVRRLFILGGRAADHFGQRRTFVLALLLFGLASLFGGVAPDRAC